MSYFSRHDDDARRRAGESPWDTTQAMPSFESPYYDDQRTQAQASPYLPAWPSAPPPLPPNYPDTRRPRRRRHRARNILVTLAALVVVLTVLGALSRNRRNNTAAATIATQIPTATNTPTPTFAAMLLDNNVGVSDDGDYRAGNFDGFGNSYSAQALAQAKLTRGAVVVYDGVRFIWPDVASGNADDMQVQEQQVDVTTTAPAATLAFLGASHFGSAQCTLTLGYADGTTQHVQLGFSDWTLGWGGMQYGNAILATLPYHNNGLQTHVKGNTYIFYAKVALQPNKILKSIAFPRLASLSQMHIFSIGVK